MDVNKLIKINNLSVELEKHGMAGDRMDAVAQARVMVEEPKVQKLEPQQAEVENGGTVLLAPEETPEPAEEVKTIKADPLMQRRFELLFEMTAKKYEEEIKGLKATVATLSSEVGFLRNEVKKAPQQAPVVPAPEPVAAAPEPAPEPVKIERQQKIEVPEAHPKRGDFGSQDVSIEKFFYYGTK